MKQKSKRMMRPSLGWRLAIALYALSVVAALASPFWGFAGNLLLVAGILTLFVSLVWLFLLAATAPQVGESRPLQILLAMELALLPVYGAVVWANDSSTQVSLSYVGAALLIVIPIVAWWAGRSLSNGEAV